MHYSNPSLLLSFLPSILLACSHPAPGFTVPLTAHDAGVRHQIPTHPFLCLMQLKAELRWPWTICRAAVAATRVTFSPHQPLLPLADFIPAKNKRTRKSDRSVEATQWATCLREKKEGTIARSWVFCRSWYVHGTFCNPAKVSRQTFSYNRKNITQMTALTYSKKVRCSVKLPVSSRYCGTSKWNVENNKNMKSSEYLTVYICLYDHFKIVNDWNGVMTHLLFNLCLSVFHHHFYAATFSGLRAKVKEDLLSRQNEKNTQRREGPRGEAMGDLYLFVICLYILI